MASIRKLNGKWIAEVRKKGNYKSKTFPSKIEALTWFVEMEQVLGGDAIVKGKTLYDACLRYRDEVSPTKGGHKYEHDRLNKFNRDDMAQIRLEDISQHDISQWIDRSLKTLKGSSVNRDLNLLSSVFQKAITWKWARTNPVRGIKRPKNSPSRTRRHSGEEIERILLALRYDTGMEVKTLH